MVAPDELETWIKSIGCSDVVTVTVKMGKQLYHGAMYTLDTSNGITRTSRRFYLLGKLPNYWIHQNIRWAYDEKLWYISGWADEKAVASHPHLHPFGKWFGLAVLDSREGDFQTRGMVVQPWAK